MQDVDPLDLVDGGDGELDGLIATNFDEVEVLHFSSILKKPGVQSPVAGLCRALDAGLAPKARVSTIFRALRAL